MQLGEIDGQISKKGYISVNDPACGAGATLIGFANAVMAKGINYQDHILFVAQDIDQTRLCAIFSCHCSDALDMWL